MSPVHIHNGRVELMAGREAAASGQQEPGLLVESTDSRLSDARTPTTHGDSLHDATVASLSGGKVPLSELPVDSLLPWLIDVNVFATAISHVNWDSLYLDTQDEVVRRKSSSGFQNDEINFDVVLAAGTWTVELMHDTLNDRGIYSVQFDGVEKGTIDGYHGTIWGVKRSALTGITVAATGKVRIKLKMATKNGSSSNYVGSIQHLQLRRTA